MTKRKSKLVDIACLVRVVEETPLAAVRQAVALAQASGAHLRLVLAVQHFKAPYTPFMGSLSKSIAAEVNQKADAQGSDIRNAAEALAGAASISVEIEVVAGPFAEVAERAANVARASDLVIVDQQHGALDTAEMLIEEALFRTGRPVMIVSPKKPPVERIRKLMVGWDGSAHAVRAVSDAIFVFDDLESIEIVTVGGEKDLSSALPAADFARHLARHGINAVLTEVDGTGRRVAKVLDDLALEHDVDLVVSGAFGHSRLREFLLGGVTVDLTSSARTSVLMAY